MRVLIATDAWHPQVNGVVRTLTSLAASAQRLGVAVDFLTPEGFPTVPVPTYPSLRLALPARRRIAALIEQQRPDGIHIATEGPIGHAMRRVCLRQNLPFTTSFHTVDSSLPACVSRQPCCLPTTACARNRRDASIR